MCSIYHQCRGRDEVCDLCHGQGALEKALLPIELEDLDIVSSGEENSMSARLGNVLYWASCISIHFSQLGRPAALSEKACQENRFAFGVPPPFA